MTCRVTTISQSHLKIRLAASYSSYKHRLPTACKQKEPPWSMRCLFASRKQHLWEISNSCGRQRLQITTQLIQHKQELHMKKDAAPAPQILSVPFCWNPTTVLGIQQAYIVLFTLCKHNKLIKDTRWRGCPSNGGNEQSNGRHQGPPNNRTQQGVKVEQYVLDPSTLIWMAL